MVWYGILGFNVPLDTVKVISETGQAHKMMTTRHTHLTAVHQDNMGKPVPDCPHSGFYWSGG